MTKQAKIRISSDILCELLELPEDSTIVGDETGNVVLVVESERLPAGSAEVIPTWITTDKEGVRKTSFLEFRPADGPR